jgi:thiamine pyrophosphate-dependent acetolactate synthase large subunit-like protein
MLANSFGIPGYRTTTTQEFFQALQDAIKKDAGAVIELVTEQEAITPNKKLSELS